MSGQVEMEYRGFRVVGDGTFGQKLIKQRGQGDVPKTLRGSYTHATFAHKAIDKYLDAPTKTKSKVKVDAKGNDNTGS